MPFFCACCWDRPFYDSTFAYTFATPATTTSANATGYRSIYNIINTDDFVTYLPFTGWGFTRYGVTKTASIIYNNLEGEWEKLVHGKGGFDYNASVWTMGKTLEVLEKIATDRNDCYIYTCSCHSSGNSTDITITNYGISESSREKAIEKIPKNALPYCKITRYIGGPVSGWNFDVCQTPEYFMQLLAATMGGELGLVKFATLNIADRYESAKGKISSSRIFGIEEPHYCESYYCIVSNT